MTFHITKGVEDIEFAKFTEYFEAESSKNKAKGKEGGNVWILKPGENSNRGNGISVSSNISEIKSIVGQKCASSGRTVIIQRYI